MIKFFRRIRQRLLGQGRLGKYAIYAIGEIVLVVIGILIALQLNQWKADAADRRMEKSHLENIRDDLKVQLEIVESQIDHEKELMDRADSARSYFNGELSMEEFESILYGTYALGYRRTFVESNSSFKELLSTGGLNLITDSELRKEMMRYQQKLEYTARVLNTNNGLVDDMFNASSTNNSPMFSLDENGELDTAVEFTGREKYRLRNAIQMRIDMCEIAIQFCETQREATNDLIEKIEERLKE